MSITNILVVDDRRENIEALSALIASEDVCILTAMNADEALALLMNNEFALALLDVQMPEMSGFELARLIRGVKRFRDLPVIFVTAHQRDQSFIFEGYETGAVDLLFKPVDPHVVRSKVRVFIELDRQARKLKQQMHDLETLRQEAEAANLAKSQFLANMSHEIRTPLGAVLGFSEVLSQQGINDVERDHCREALRRNGQLLTKIIDDILDLSKVEAQRLDIESIRTNMAEIVSDVQSTLTFRALEKEIKLNFEIDTQIDGHFRSDPTRIKQVLLNIIGNAIKFTRQGSVDVRVGMDKPGGFRVTVTDSGVGLSKEQISRLFQPFSQADSSTRRKFGGTGLGLLISRQLARALKGDVQLVRSEIGLGSTFEITLNLEADHDGDHMVSSAPNLGMRDLTGKSVLVVDDAEDNRSLIEYYLKGTGLKVFQAGNGEDALQVYRTQALDMILMDIQMPKMDGYEVTREIRASGGKLPILAFTAHAMRNEIEKCIRSGCDAVLTKPVSRDQLLNGIASYLGHPPVDRAHGSGYA